YFVEQVRALRKVVFERFLEEKDAVQHRLSVDRIAAAGGGQFDRVEQAVQRLAVGNFLPRQARMAQDLLIRFVDDVDDHILEVLLQLGGKRFHDLAHDPSDLLQRQ